MAWITMSNGGEMSMDYPRQEDMQVEAMAHSIAQIVRYNGHACRPYSVAEHSLLVMRIARDHLQLDVHGLFYALCHDLHEALTGDQTSPSKERIGQGWHAFEGHFAHEVALSLGMLTAKHNNIANVVTADRMAMAVERDQLLPKVQPNGRPSTPWPMLAKVPLITDVNLMSPERVQATWEFWRDEWLRAFYALDAARRSPTERRELQP